MSHYTVVSSSYRRPLYAAWKCAKCNRINFTKGSLFFKGRSSAPGRQTGYAAQFAQNNLTERMLCQAGNMEYEVTFHLQKHPGYFLHYNISFMNDTCRYCKKKGNWFPSFMETTLSLWIMFFAVALFVFICLLFSDNMIKYYAWIPAAALLVPLVISVRSLVLYPRRFSRIKPENFPEVVLFREEEQFPSIKKQLQNELIRRIHNKENHNPDIDIGQNENL